MNGTVAELDEDNTPGKNRPADIDADLREMERRKRVDLIMNSRMFREELERIIESQLRDGTSGTSSILQKITDMMGFSSNATRIQTGGLFKNLNCVIPINDIRGIENISYDKGEKILRCKQAALFRLVDLFGWSYGGGALGANNANNVITARLSQDLEHFLANPFSLMYHEITASSLIKADMQGNVIEQGTTNYVLNLNSYLLNTAIHATRPDLKCIIAIQTPAILAISALKSGLLPLSHEACLIGNVSMHQYSGNINSAEERDRIVRNFGPINKVLLLINQGAICAGETVEEAFFYMYNLVIACETQLRLISVPIDQLNLIDEDERKEIYDQARQVPDNGVIAGRDDKKWRLGGVEFEALMRMLDNSGFRTGYISRYPLIKTEPPKPRNDCEVPPAVSHLGYLLEEEEMYKQGTWKKLEGGRKGNERSRWLNSPNVYQKVEILETGTDDPKKITKWVAEDSPTHSSTPVKIDTALQFVPANTNPKEFKKLQKQIKDYRRADKISAGPQSQILDGVTLEEAQNIQRAAAAANANNSVLTNDRVVMMGAASKGIIQRDYQHNATVYKTPYAKNPFDRVTDEDLDEYKKVVEKKSKGEYDTDISESEPNSHCVLNAHSLKSPVSETEDDSHHQVIKLETKHAPKPSQPELVMSDGEVTYNGADHSDAHLSTFSHSSKEGSPMKEHSVSEETPKKDKKKKKGLRTPSFLKKKKEKKKAVES